MTELVTMMVRGVRVEMSNNVCVTLKYSSPTTAPAHKPAPPTARISLRDTESGPHMATLSLSTAASAARQAKSQRKARRCGGAAARLKNSSCLVLARPCVNRDALSTAMSKAKHTKTQ